MTTDQTRKFIVQTLGSQNHRWKLIPKPGIDMPLTPELADALRIAAGADRTILSVIDVTPPRQRGDRWVFQVLVEDLVFNAHEETLYIEDALRSYPTASPTTLTL